MNNEEIRERVRELLLAYRKASINYDDWLRNGHGMEYQDILIEYQARQDAAERELMEFINELQGIVNSVITEIDDGKNIPESARAVGELLRINTKAE